jgi:hypothetical protein
MVEVADNIRTEILSEAIKVLGNRGITHGEAYANMSHTAVLWGAYLSTYVSPVDVAIMMVMLKASRIKTGDATHRDSFVDMCGYAAIAGEVSERTSK